MIKIALFLVSALPVFLLVKSLMFKRHSGVRLSVSNFNKQVGYLSAGIAIILAVLTLYHFVSVWFR